MSAADSPQRTAAPGPGDLAGRPAGAGRRVERLPSPRRPAPARRSRRTPLWRAAAGRPFRAGSGGGLVAVAFALLAVAAASGPLVTATTGSAALRQVLGSAPDAAAAERLTRVAVVGGAAPSDPEQARVVEQLGRLPGAGAPVVSGGSLEPDLLPPGSLVPYLASSAGQEPARLYAVDDPAARLQQVGDAAPAGLPGPAVWVPQPLAASLRLTAGDPVRLGSLVGGTAAPETVVDGHVAGVYAVGEDGRRPADPPGERFWQDPLRALPRDALQAFQRSRLAVVDVDTAPQVAEQLSDSVLWSASVSLDVPRGLEQADAVVADLREVERAVGFLGAGLELVQGANRQPSVVSDVPDLVEGAHLLADAARARTQTLQRGGLALGLAAVLGSALLLSARRRTELRLSAGLGRRARTTALQTLLETLPLAAVATVAGGALAAAGVALSGPDAPLGARAVEAGAVRAGLALAVGLVLVTAVAGVAARQAARRTGGEGHRVPVPWVGLLVAVAITTVIGLLGRPSGGLGALDLLVPVLVAAATGALGATLLRALVRRAGARASQQELAGGAPLTPRRATAVLAVRRLGGPGQERVLVVALISTGLGLALHVLAGTAAVDRAVDDKTALLAGAEVSAYPADTFLLDPTLPLQPPPGIPPPPELEPPRDLRVAPGDTVVWRQEARVDGTDALADLLVIDPATFAAGAAWGAPGGALAPAREMLPLLEREEAAAVRARADGQRGAPVPVLVAGLDGYGPGDQLTLRQDEDDVPVRVVGAVAHFPGQEGDGDHALVVLPSDAYLPELPVDPRTRPEDGAPRRSDVRVALWSSRSLGQVTADLERLDAGDVRFQTRERTATAPSFASWRLVRGYQLALAVAVALVAALALCLSAERSAARARPAAVILARAGLGRRGPVAALLLEAAVLVAAGLGLAVAAVVVLRPLAGRLFDPAPWTAPPLAPVLPAGAVAVTAAMALAAWLAAAAVVVVVSRSRRDEEVLRGAE